MLDDWLMLRRQHWLLLRRQHWLLRRQHWLLLLLDDWLLLLLDDWLMLRRQHWLLSLLYQQIGFQLRSYSRPLGGRLFQLIIRSVPLQPILCPIRARVLSFSLRWYRSAITWRIGNRCRRTRSANSRRAGKRTHRRSALLPQT